MSTSALTLDSIRAAAEAKYGSTDIAITEESVCRLLNPLRLTKEARTALQDTQRLMSEDDADQEELLSQAILTVSATKREGQALLDAIGGDLAILAEVFGAYGEGTQVGEASASAA